MLEVGGDDFEVPEVLAPDQQVIAEIAADNCLDTTKEAVGT